MRRVVLFAVAFALLAAGVASAAQKVMYVTVKETVLRASPGYLGKAVGGPLVYGDAVTLLDQPADTPKGWVKVLGPDKKLVVVYLRKQRGGVEVVGIDRPWESPLIAPKQIEARTH